MSDKISNKSIFSNASDVIADAEMKNFDANLYISGDDLFAKIKGGTGTVSTYIIGSSPASGTISLTPGSNGAYGLDPPTILPAGALPVWNFDYIATNDLNMSFALPSDYFPSTAIELRVNWATTQVSGNQITWSLAYGHSRIGQLMDGAQDAIINANQVPPAVSIQAAQTLFLIDGVTYQYEPGDIVYFDLELSVPPAADFLAMSSIIINYQRVAGQ
jgi:hypothetical protein